MIEKARADTGNVEFYRWPTNRGWIRDFGPTGIRRGGRTPEVAVAKFKFTAWGYKHPTWQRDNRVPFKVAEALHLRLFRAQAHGRDLPSRAAASTSTAAARFW